MKYIKAHKIGFLTEKWNVKRKVNEGFDRTWANTMKDPAYRRRVADNKRRRDAMLTIKLNGKMVMLDNPEVDGIDGGDYPDFTDAYITSVDIIENPEEKDPQKLIIRPATDDELDEINDDGGLIHDIVNDSLY